MRNDTRLRILFVSSILTVLLNIIIFVVSLLINLNLTIPFYISVLIIIIIYSAITYVIEGFRK